MPEYVDGDIGPLEVAQEGDHQLLIVGERHCARCGALVPGEKIGVGWTKIFVEERYNFCCNPCCPGAGENPCPKERNEGKDFNPIAWPIVIKEIDGQQN